MRPHMLRQMILSAASPKTDGQKNQPELVRIFFTALCAALAARAQDLVVAQHGKKIGIRSCFCGSQGCGWPHSSAVSLADTVAAAAVAVVGVSQFAG